jgi:hypothetical protein
MKNKLKVKIKSKLKVVMLTTAGLVPLVLVSMAVLVTQVSYNHRFSVLLSQKSVYNSKI